MPGYLMKSVTPFIGFPMHPSGGGIPSSVASVGTISVMLIDSLVSPLPIFHPYQINGT